MASTIRVRATSNGDITEVQALIQHPMDSGFVKDSKGEIIPAHFIQQLTFEYDGKPVFVADWGGGVSKDPYVKFAFKGGEYPGTLGPELTDIKGKYPNRDELVAIVFDETKRNPLTVMPPFGRNRILTDKEINAIVDFLQTL